MNTVTRTGHPVNATTTTTGPTGSSPVAATRGRGPQSYARAAGAMYLVIFVFGLFAELGVRARLIDPGSPSATAENILGSEGLFRLAIAADTVMVIADVAVAVLLFVLLRPAGRVLALAATAFRLVHAAVLGVVVLAEIGALLLLDDDGPAGGLSGDVRDALTGVTLEAHAYGYLMALVFFGVHLLLVWRLIARASYFPTWLGVLLGIAGVGYLADSFAHFLLPGYHGAATAILLAPAIVAEFAMILWLLVKGVDTAAWRRDVEPGSEVATEAVTDETGASA